MSRDTNTPAIGSPVYDAAGVPVGVVDDIQPPAFHLDARKGSSMWLNLELIDHVETGGTTLRYPLDDLEAFELEGPAPVRSEAPALDEQMDVFESRSEQAATRREMRDGYPDSVTPPLDARSDQRGSSS